MRRSPYVLAMRSKRQPSPLGLKFGNTVVEDGIQLPKRLDHLSTCYSCGNTWWLNTTADVSLGWRSYGQKGLYLKVLPYICRVACLTWENSSLSKTAFIRPGSRTRKDGSANIKNNTLGCSIGGILLSLPLCCQRVVLKFLFWFAAGGCNMRRCAYYMCRIGECFSSVPMSSWTV